MVDELIIFDFRNHCHITNVRSCRGVHKLGVEGLIVTNGTIIILELIESDTTDFDAGLTRGGSGLRAQIVHKHVLVVSEGVLNVSMMEHNISAIVLPIAARSENHSIRNADSG